MYARLFSLLSLLSLVPLGTSAQASEPVRFLRHPHVANDGRVVFCYHGDIWIAEADGARPRRLTDNIAPEVFPRFSPDGKWVAFSSERNGNRDLFVVPSEGGAARQLTFHTTDDTLLYWTPEGDRLLFQTGRGTNPWGAPLYTVDLEGHLPEPLAMDRGAAGMIRQDGEWLAFNRIGFRYWRKHYRGNNNTDVWLQHMQSGELRQLTDLDPQKYQEHAQDAYPMWGDDGWIYFMSERGGAFNIWRTDVEGKDFVQVTHHSQDGVQYPSISPDGKRIVYENEFELWALDLPDGEPRRIMVELGFDVKTNTESWTRTDSIDGFAPSPDGEQVAVDVSGELFLLPADSDFGEKEQLTDTPWRDRYERYSPDGKWLAWITDASGEEEIWLRDLEEGRSEQLTTHDSTKDGFLWSNDSKQIAFEAANSLFLIDVESRELDELSHNENFGYSLAHFSADDRWLVYSRSDDDLDSEVYLFEIATRNEINVTQHPARDGSPRLTPDGKNVVFTSDRDGDSHLYSVSLARWEEDPDDPLVRARERDAKKNKGKDKGKSKKKDDSSEKEGEGAPKDEGESGDDAAKGEEVAKADSDGESDSESGEETEAEEEALEIAIDLEDIDRRPRRLTRGDTSVSSVFLSKDGKTIYYVASQSSGSSSSRFGFGGGSRKLWSTDLLGRDAKEIASVSGRSVVPNADLTHVFYRDDGKVQRLSIKGGKPKAISASLRVRVDHAARWEQMFEESWRVMKYRFYDEDMHGYDWDALKARYKPLLRYVGQNQDLYDLCNEMIGELNASHTGVSGPDSQQIERPFTTRHLGFSLETDGDFYRVGHVHREGPADKEWLDLTTGDYVLAIDGESIRAGDNYWRILNHVLNTYVSVQVASPASAETPGGPPYGEVRTLRIKSVTSTRDLMYEEWVHSRRERVDELSGGKIGYVHIRSMNRSSLERFEQEIDRYWNKNGMIVDIRYNGGGNIDQELIDILERRPYEYWNYRWGGRAFGRRPRQCIAGPKVMMINWRSASDSEVTPQAFRDLELGRIVGNPTYGAVIATGSYGLMGGARIRTPSYLVVTYDPTQPNNYGTNLENYGVPPDVWVENTPQDELAGYDRELETAVAEALEMLGQGTWQYGEDEGTETRRGAGSIGSQQR